jgi:hypothetical protein
MKRTSRIVSTAVATMVLAVLAAPVVATAADHHASATPASSAHVAAIGWPGDDVKPGHDPS